MIPPRRILVPVELGDNAGPAREAAAALASALDAELLLLGVATVLVRPAMPGPSELPLTPVDLVPEQQAIERLVRERLDEALDALPPEVRARAELRWGQTGPTIVDGARDEHADLVVVTRRNESALEHLLDEHMQRYVLQHSSVPVLVVGA